MYSGFYSANVCEYTVFTIKAQNFNPGKMKKIGSIRNKWRYKSTIVNFKCLIKFITHYLAHEQLYQPNLKQKNLSKGV